jgi:hypothetical protein
MRVQIKLKRKYLAGFKSRNQGGERGAPKKNRTKLNDAARKALPPQPKRVLVVNGRTGAGVMRDY